MRRTMIIAVLAACAGFVLARAAAFGATKANIWQQYGPEFRLGYVIGYLDAASLASRGDRRARVAAAGKTYINRYVKGVDDYFANGANADREVPDAMAAVGEKVRKEWMQDWARRTGMIPSPSPSSGP